jgi:lysophospholipase L1-like esterase
MIRSIAISLLCLLWLSACDQSPRLTPLSQNATILAFGDSLTYGTGAGLAGAYPAQLEKRLGKRVVNAGVPGEVSGAGLKRLPQLLAQHQPELVILCHGGNDLLKRRSQDELRDNLRRMIELIRRQGAQVVLVAVPAPGLLVEPPQLYTDLANEYNLPCQADILARLLTTPDLKSDLVHLNAAGYARLAEALETLLQKAKAI